MIYLKSVTRKNSSVSYVPKCLKDQLDGERTYLRLLKIHKLERMKLEFEDMSTELAVCELCCLDKAGKKFPAFFSGWKAH